MEPKPSQKSTGTIMAGLGAILLVVGLLLCVLVYSVVTKNNQYSESGVVSYGWIFVCGGLPLTFIGLIVFLVGLIMSFAEKKL